MRDDSTSGGAVRMRGNSVRKNRPGFQKGSDLRILRAAVHFGWNRFGIIDGHAFTLIGKSASRGIGNARTLRSTVIRSDGERLQDQVRDRIRV